MKKKQILTILLTGLVSLSALTGCVSEPVTVESLMKGAYGKEKVTSGEMEMILYMDADVKAEISEGQNMSMEMEVEMDVDIEFDKDTSHMKGNVGATILGMSFEEEMESYVQKEKKETITYDKDNETGNWVISYGVDEEDEDDFNFKDLTQLDTSVFEDLELKEAEKDDDEYVVEGSVSAEEMKDSMNGTFEDIFGSFTEGTDTDYDEFVYNITAVFDKETKLLKSIKMEVDPDEVNSKELTVKEMYIEVIVNKLNDVEVEVPKKVAKNAIKESENDENSDDSLAEVPDNKEENNVNNNTKPNNNTNNNSNVENNNSGNNSNITPTGNWKDLVFTFNDATMQLHKTTLNEFINNTNYTIDEDDTSSEYVLNPGDTKLISMGLKSGDLEWNYLWLEVYNNTSSLATVKDCVISEIDYDASGYLCDEKVNATMSVAGVSIGNKISNFAEIFGEPYSTYSSDGITSYTWEEDTDEELLELRITYSDTYGVIGIQLSSYVW